MHDLKSLLQKYFNGECSDSEKAELLRLLEEDPDLLNMVFDNRLEESYAPEWLPDAETAGKMKRVILGATTPVVPIRRRTTLKWWAAAAVLALGAGLAWYLAQQPTKPGPVAAKENAKPAAYQPATDTTIRNTSGKVQQLTLADGSWIKLSPGGEVKMKTDFRNHRQILLKGKAVFDVAKDMKHPFSVQASNIVTTALGTRFGIETGEGGAVNVRLLQGKVQVTGTHMQQAFKPVILRPGDVFSAKQQIPGIQVARAIPVQNNETRTTENSTIVTATGFSFHNEKLRDVLVLLKAHYQQNVTITPDVSKKATFTGEFSKTDSLISILQVLADLNNLNIERTDSTIILKPAK
ncbi:FecR family protein [Chitinophaga terrae (ex Kim and Jung 2007)]|uniref:FecR family protein n=1 Tax=Chitinophaga terrae (ex Kim and Jung 2007) TaxID=408074 RepID=A0A1H3WVZ9_9BACT|nr:FecR domain-containing protein [Chitinophaga terrae (ex Kim and Jung 2007)]GEP90319.1 hypothetical protein CTE07_19640 [Chitinophaga terrae (ex Kim and Jung 2007)]SDZ90512.1 FecR family protein [Chitinophaga terrae (ex Kim and Jung 2007)]